MPFFIGFSFGAGTLISEVVLTRFLSVISWYYLAFVSVSMAMFGMTAGALAVQLRPPWFGDRDVTRRMVQWTLAMAVSIPLSLMTMLSVPLYLAAASRIFILSCCCRPSLPSLLLLRFAVSLSFPGFRSHRTHLFRRSGRRGAGCCFGSSLLGCGRARARSSWSPRCCSQAPRSTRDMRARSRSRNGPSVGGGTALDSRAQRVDILRNPAELGKAD